MLWQLWSVNAFISFLIKRKWILKDLWNGAYLPVQETVEQRHNKALQSRKWMNRFSQTVQTTVILQTFDLYPDVSHLERAQAELNEDPSLGSRVFGEHGEHHVVHPEERDEQQRGLGEPPARIRASEPRADCSPEAA